MTDTTQRILVPIDFSAPSRDALRQGLAWAKRLGAEVEVLHVWEAPAYVTPANLVWLNGDERCFWDHVERDLEERLELLVREVRGPDDPPVTRRVLAGYVSQTILRVIDEGSYDLVVVGSHGRRGLSRWLLGSVAERVARAARCPVLIARSDEEARQAVA